MDFEEYKKEVDKNIMSLFEKANSVEKELLNNMIRTINEKCEKEQRAVGFLKDAMKYANDLLNATKINDLYYMGKVEAYNEILSMLTEDASEQNRFE